MAPGEKKSIVIEIHMIMMCDDNIQFCLCHFFLKTLLSIYATRLSKIPCEIKSYYSIEYATQFMQALPSEDTLCPVIIGDNFSYSVATTWNGLTEPHSLIPVGSSSIKRQSNKITYQWTWFPEGLLTVTIYQIK